MTDGVHADVARLVGGLRPRRRRRPRGARHHARGVPRPRPRRAAATCERRPEPRPSCASTWWPRRIAGDVATTREDNLLKYGLLRGADAQGDVRAASRRGRLGPRRRDRADGRAGRRLARPVVPARRRPHRPRPHPGRPGPDRGRAVARAARTGRPGGRWPPDIRPGCCRCTCRSRPACGRRAPSCSRRRPASATSTTTRSGRVDRAGSGTSSTSPPSAPAASSTTPTRPSRCEAMLADPRRGRRAAAGPGRRRPRLGRCRRAGGRHDGRASPTRTTRRCSSARPRARSRCRCRWTTTSTPHLYAPMTAYLLHAAGLGD